MIRYGKLDKKYEVTVVCTWNVRLRGHREVDDVDFHSQVGLMDCICP